MKLIEIDEMLPLAKAYELNPTAKYLFLIDAGTNPTHAYLIQQWLQLMGVDAVVLPLDCTLFEIERKPTT